MMPLRLTRPTVGLMPTRPLIDEGETMAAIRDRILAMGAKRFLSVGDPAG